MPVLVEPDPTQVEALLKAMPAGSHAVASADRMQAWLEQHHDEYVVVLGPSPALEDVEAVCSRLRVAHPTVSVLLVRESLSTETLARAMKSGARDVVAANDPDAVVEAVERARQLFVALRGPSGAAQQGRVVTVFSPKGGVGKTTVAVNLALALTDKGARSVCLVDLDLAFGDVAITMQLFPTHSIEQAVGSENTIDLPMLEGLLTRHQDSLMLLAAPSHPDVRDRVTPVLVSKILRTLREGFDYVVVDTAPSFDDQTLTALDETDECVIVATLDVPTLKNVKVALETLEVLDIARGHRHLLLNRADEAVGISTDKVESILGMEIAAHVASSVEIAAATNAGTPIITAKPQHQSSAAMVALASKVVGEEAALVAAPQSNGTAHASQPRAGRFRRKREVHA
jgi:pilus assembly protein CpaE